MRVALVYDRLNKIGGAEAVLIQFAKLYPNADWYTSVWDPTRAPFSSQWRVHTSWINQIPFLRNHHEWIPWLMPFIFESFNFSPYDLVISIGSAESKGVITRPGTIHLNYCLTPTRYLYSHQKQYLTTSIHRYIAKYLRAWDQVAATRPDIMIAISTQVKKRIKKYYNRDVDIIFPPVDITRFKPSRPGLEGKYFLVVSRLVPYKKIDILISAANLAQVNLVIIGEGSEYSRLRALAGKTVSLLGHVVDHELPGYYQHCRAYLQANEEDFGISMCEALAAGRPVIAYERGGASDIVIPGKNGILLYDNSVAAFAGALKEFDTMSFVAADCINSVSRFNQDTWQQKIRERINKIWIKTLK